MQKRILAIGDIHFPFVNLASLKRIEALARELKPVCIIQVGDLFDLINFSTYAKSLNILTPKEELKRGQKMAYQMWENLKKASPKAKCFQLLGNHDERIVKRLMEKAPELETLMDVASLFKFPGVETSRAEAEELVIKDILFMHGYRKHGDHVKHNALNTVCGHSHKGGVVYHRLGKKTLWELNAGFIADEASPALKYKKQTVISTWTQGVAFIDELGPRFIPF